jgi:hypothetical protein
LTLAKTVGKRDCEKISPDKKITVHAKLAFIREQNKAFCRVMKKGSGQNAFGVESPSGGHLLLSQGSDVVHILM